MFKPTSGVHSYTTYEVPQKMFLYQGPLLKLLSGLLAIGGSHVELPRKCA